MQTVELKFTKLDKLPIPESAQEILLVERADGMIRPIDIFDSMLTGKLAFNCHFSKELRYCHLKVTAATEPKFKVEDRVTSKAYPHIQGKILHLNFETALVYDYSENYVLDLTDLTLITE